MNHSNYQKELGATADCTKIMMEATKGIGQNYRKGQKMIVLFLIVGSPQRRRKKLQWKLVPSLLVW